jgi:hypothetical protein
MEASFLGRETRPYRGVTPPKAGHGGLILFTGCTLGVLRKALAFAQRNP